MVQVPESVNPESIVSVAEPSANRVWVPVADFFPSVHSILNVLPIYSERSWSPVSGVGFESASEGVAIDPMTIANPRSPKAKAFIVSPI